MLLDIFFICAMILLLIFLICLILGIWENHPYIFVILTLITFISLAVYSIGNQEKQTQKELLIYNHGYHIIDNGQWDVTPVGHDRYTTYFYKCKKCEYSWQSDTLYH